MQHLVDTFEPLTQGFSSRHPGPSHSDAHVRDLRWLRALIERLDGEGLVQTVDEVRVRLMVSQAQINDLQGRDRNSGVVSRRCHNLRNSGVIEDGVPLVVRLDRLPPAPVLRSVGVGAGERPRKVSAPPSFPATRPRQLPDEVVELRAGLPAPSLIDDAQGPYAAVATSSADSVLADALLLCCEAGRWGLAEKLVNLLERDRQIRAVLPDLPRDPREPRDPRDPRVIKSFDDEEFTSSSVSAPHRPRDIRAGSRGPGKDLSRLSSEAHPSARLTARTMLELLEPLRQACRQRGLPDLDDVNVLLTAFDAYAESEVEAAVQTMVERLEGGAAIRSPFGLLVTTARRGSLLSSNVKVTRQPGIDPGHSKSAPLPAWDPESIEDLVGRGDVESAGRGDVESTWVAASIPGEDFVRSRLSHMRKELRSSTGDISEARLATMS